MNTHGHDVMTSFDDANPANKALDDNKLAYSIEETCEIIGCGRTKIYGEIAAGRLKARNFGSLTKILPPDLVDFIGSWPLFGEKERMK